MSHCCPALPKRRTLLPQLDVTAPPKARPLAMAAAGRQRLARTSSSSQVATLSEELSTPPTARICPLLTLQTARLPRLAPISPGNALHLVLHMIHDCAHVLLQMLLQQVRKLPACEQVCVQRYTAPDLPSRGSKASTVLRYFLPSKPPTQKIEPLTTAEAGPKRGVFSCSTFVHWSVMASYLHQS